MRDVRGNGIAMIFQEPMTSLNPVLTIGEQVASTLTLHQQLTSKAARARVLELLTLVRMSAPLQRIDQYPHGCRAACANA